jgi:CMP-N-acetylneuraminic acid synthetase
MLKEVIGLIPVKGNSERVDKKNLRPFHDTTLYELKLGQLKKTKNFKKIIISSENENVLETARQQGFGVHKRDPYYSTSHVPMSEVYTNIASEIEGENIAWINLTNPLAEAEIYDQAVETFSKLPVDRDCLLSAYEMKEYVFFDDKPLNFKPNPWPKSQDLKGMLALSFVINILKRQDMVKWGSTVGSAPYFYMLDDVVSTDIDYQHDFDFCEMVYRRNLSKG